MRYIIALVVKFCFLFSGGFMKKVPFFIYIDLIMLSCIGIFDFLTALVLRNSEKFEFELQTAEVAA